MPLILTNNVSNTFWFIQINAYSDARQPIDVCTIVHIYICIVFGDMRYALSH